MKIIRYPAGVYQANCYILYDDDTKEGLIVDPGGSEDEIIELVKKLEVSLKCIMLTHGHFDHNGAVNKLKLIFKVPVYINEHDLFLISGKELPYLPSSEAIAVDGFLKEGDVYVLGHDKVKIIETPGHTPGGVVIDAGDFIITGDTLFNNSVGRTDLPGGSHEDLIMSIKEKLLTLSDTTVVYPGHGPATTIGEERNNNPFL